MKCPNCQETLIMTERQGVEIDYCPSCRGVWLDKGELDKIIERAAQAESGGGAKPQKEKKQWEDRDDDDDDDNGMFGGQRRGNRRKGGFLGDLFDFG